MHHISFEMHAGKALGSGMSITIYTLSIFAKTLTHIYLYFYNVLNLSLTSRLQTPILSLRNSVLKEMKTKTLSIFLRQSWEI